MPHAIQHVVGPIKGVGLFTGKPASLWFHPWRDGLVFERDGSLVPARTENLLRNASWLPEQQRPFVRNTVLCVPGRESVHVITVEHVLSALAGLGVWNARVIVDGPECPILDGSSRAFTDALRSGIAPVANDAEPMRLVRQVEVRDAHGATITAYPLRADEPASCTYELDLGPNAPIPAHRATWALDEESYVRDIAPARTFSTESEVRAAFSRGLFDSFTPRDLLVIAADGTPMENAWRFSEHGGGSTEPARHKLLDLIGDLALLGRPLHARVVARRSGHALTHRLCEALQKMS